MLKNGDLICASISSGNLTVWDTNNWTIKKVLVGFSMNLSIQFSNGDLALIKGPYIFILNTTDWTSKLNLTLTNLASSLYSVVAINNDDIVSSSTDKIIRVWNSTSGRLKEEYSVQNNQTLLAVLKNGNLALSSFGFFISIYDTNTKINRLSLNNEINVTSIEVLENGDLVSGGIDGLIRIFDVNTGLLKFLLGQNLNSGSVRAIKAFENGDFAVGSDDGKIRIWKYFYY